MSHQASVAFGLLVLTLAVSGCSLLGGNVDAETEAAKGFDTFPLYWLGDSFEGWELETIEGVEGENPVEFITIIYGDCVPKGEDEPSCVPPLQLQISPLCAHLTEVAQAPIWKRRHVRGRRSGRLTALLSSSPRAPR